MAGSKLHEAIASSFSLRHHTALAKKGTRHSAFSRLSKVAHIEQIHILGVGSNPLEKLQSLFFWPLIFLFFNSIDDEVSLSGSSFSQFFKEKSFSVPSCCLGWHPQSSPPIPPSSWTWPFPASSTVLFINLILL